MAEDWWAAAFQVGIYRSRPDEPSTEALLEDLLAVLEDRQVAVCVELTKKFQNIHRGWLADLAKEFSEKTVKGEVVVVADKYGVRITDIITPSERMRRLSR